MTDAEAERWVRQRDAGRARFVLVHGVGWGVLTLLVSAVWESASGGLSLQWWTVSVPLWLIAGAGFGFVLWSINGRLYRARGQDAG